MEDLLEQEKREQERQQMNSAGGDATQQNIDQVRVVYVFLKKTLTYYSTPFPVVPEDQHD